MLYVIIAKDCENSLKKRQQNRPKHLERLELLKQQGKLVLAGPNPKIDLSTPTDDGFVGSIIVAEFDDLQQAQDWANQDPYLKVGVYQTVEVLPFIKVLP